MITWVKLDICHLLIYYLLRVVKRRISFNSITWNILEALVSLESFFLFCLATITKWNIFGALRQMNIHQILWVLYVSFWYLLLSSFLVAIEWFWKLVLGLFCWSKQVIHFGGYFPFLINLADLTPSCSTAKVSLRLRFTHAHNYTIHSFI